MNFGYHNAHHQRASVPWYRLPAYHRELYGENNGCEMPISGLLSTWHHNRVRRVFAATMASLVRRRRSEGRRGGEGRADNFIGAHGCRSLR